MITILRCASLALLPAAMLAAGASAQAHGMKHHHHQHRHHHHGAHGHKDGMMKSMKCVPTPDHECHDNGPNKAPSIPQ